jgi:hypothetical protein
MGNKASREPENTLIRDSSMETSRESENYPILDQSYDSFTSIRKFIHDLPKKPKRAANFRSMGYEIDLVTALHDSLDYKPLPDRSRLNVRQGLRVRRQHFLRQQ